MTDQKIIDLYFARDEKAILETERAHGAFCMGVSMSILNNRMDAEECVNDTYLKAWNSIPPHKPTALRLFLGKIVRNTAIDRYRQRKTKGESFAVTLEELAEILPAREEDDGHLGMLLAGFLEDLSPEERNFFILRYWHGHSVARIAKAFRMKPNNLSARLYRTREKLRSYLSKEGFSV